jgi:hypothetical protein
MAVLSSVALVPQSEYRKAKYPRHEGSVADAQAVEEEREKDETGEPLPLRRCCHTDQTIFLR